MEGTRDDEQLGDENQDSRHRHQVGGDSQPDPRQAEQVLGIGAGLGQTMYFVQAIIDLKCYLQ